MMVNRNSRSPLSESRKQCEGCEDERNQDQARGGVVCLKYASSDAQVALTYPWQAVKSKAPPNR
jgi:hypothetical protein